MNKEKKELVEIAAKFVKSLVRDQLDCSEIFTVLIQVICGSFFCIIESHGIDEATRMKTVFLKAFERCLDDTFSPEEKS
jgi:hypothetical protein